jgi:cyclic pyranopterin phosphate synthase
VVAKVWSEREDRYSEVRTDATAQPGNRRPKIEMSYIGG